MADNINQYIQGLLGQNYQTPMQGGLLGAAQAVAPLAGYTSRPVSMGQVLGAAGGGAMRGQQQAQMQNMMMGSNVQQMQNAQAQQATAQQAARLAAMKRLSDYQAWTQLSPGLQKFQPAPPLLPSDIEMAKGMAGGQAAPAGQGMAPPRTPPVGPPPSTAQPAATVQQGGLPPVSGPPAGLFSDPADLAGGAADDPLAAMRHEFDLMPIQDVQGLTGHTNPMIAGMAKEYLKDKAKSRYSTVQNPLGMGGRGRVDQYGAISGYQAPQKPITRDLSMAGGMIQNEEYDPVKKTWKAVGAPYSRRGKGMTVYDRDGNPIMSTGDGGGDKPFARGLKKDIMSDQEALDSMNYVTSLYEPEFLSYGGQGKAAWDTFLNKLDPENRSQFTARRSAFVSQTNQAFIAYRKWATGVAGGEKEMAEIKRSTYSEDDSPQDFEAKIAGMKQMTKKLMVRKAMALKSGIEVGSKAWKGFVAATSLDGIPNLQQRGDALANLGYSEAQVLGILQQEGYK